MILLAELTDEDQLLCRRTQRCNKMSFENFSRFLDDNDLTVDPLEHLIEFRRPRRSYSDDFGVPDDFEFQQVLDFADFFQTCPSIRSLVSSMIRHRIVEQHGRNGSMYRVRQDILPIFEPL